MNNKIFATNKDIVFYKKNNGEMNIELLLNGETDFALHPSKIVMTSGSVASTFSKTAKFCHVMKAKFLSKVNTASCTKSLWVELTF